MKVGLILMLENGTFIHPLPTDGSVKRLSAAEVKAELLYNRIPFSKILFMVNLTMGGVLAFFLLLYHSLQRKLPSPPGNGCFCGWSVWPAPLRFMPLPCSTSRVMAFGGTSVDVCH